ncbi:hypothetical protein [Roseofilum casamattae]|uniref:Uncharacterized protein n=1 Tax=Roseofilum casamattae BLCC-M143 TaxID=3022442 RepID=A0ABT7BV46_9CYAN|nr:hypothetical protein [Roseofilum casamattae]MDJ1183069.1 hypothetical protein [Roseofilum casamattae BLCC-M143]
MSNDPTPRASWKPIGDPNRMAGFTIPAPFQTKKRPTDAINFENLQKAAGALKDDPLQVQKLADRVYSMLMEDLHQQKDRKGLYGGKH